MALSRLFFPASSHRGGLGVLAALLGFAALTATPALAQPNKRPTPPIRTPATPAKPGTPPAGSPTPTDPNGKPTVDPNDPLTKVNQGPKEIEFRPKGAGDLVSFNLDDADLPDLVKAIGQVTGKRFIYGAKVKSLKATVYSPDKVTAAEAYNAFLAILMANGLTVIPHGQFLEITESTLVATQNTPMYGTASPTPNEDRYVTRLYRLQSVDAGEVKTVLDKFKSKDGDITVYAPGNLLIITDTGENLRRLLRLIEEIDVGAAGDQIWVQPVLNGSATETATKLNEILNLKGGSGGKGSANIVADERTNSLIITSTKGDYDRLLELLKRIDVPTTGDGQLHVLPLQHALCADLSTTLNGILGGGGGAARTGGATGARAGATARPAAAPAAGGAAGGTNEDIFEGQVKITCDEATNSLVTTSSQHDYAQLRTVIDKLDQPRRQVFIEAVIMDLDVNHSTDWGVGYHGGAPLDIQPDDPGFIYGGNNPGPSLSGLPSNLEALALGVRGPEVPGSENLLGTGVSIPALGIVLHAVAKDGDSNVLATPHILATDSVKASISIGQDIPYQTNLGNLGSIASAIGGQAGAGALAGLGGLLGGGLGGGQGGRTEVGTKLEVTPHINDSDQVRLEIVETISDLGSRDGALGAATINKREASTTLIVRDQQTVVIGGLMRESEGVSETKVPVLGDIPILGFLFKQQVKTRQKSNLLLILTPYVIRDQEDLRAIFERKMQERQEFLDRYFVFSDEDWEPPEDYTRKNGLVESIRQSQIEADEKQRIIEDARPRTPKTHDAVEPVPLPSIASQKPAADGTQPTTNPTNPTTAPATTPGRGKVRVPGQPAPPKVE